MIDKIKGKVLVYTRRRRKKFFHEVAERTFDGEIIYCSDWLGLEEINFMPAFYRHYKADNLAPELAPEELNEIITRCRILRLLPKAQSEKMTHAMYVTITEIVEKYKPNFFFAHNIDHYIPDIFCRVCQNRNLKIIILNGSCVVNRIFVSKYGEYNKVGDPREEEVRQVLNDFLDDNYHITYGSKLIQYSLRKHLKTFLVWWVKYMVFQIMSLIYKDPLNYRFLFSSLKIEMGKTAIFNFKGDYCDMDWYSKMNEAVKPILYVPLSFTPESTTDYWLKDTRYVDYENFILSLALELSKTYTVVVKDHWAMLGIRYSSFYSKLKSIPEVILIPSHINNRLILKLVETVIVGVGTTGIESALRGKKVITLSEPYYYVEGHFLNIGSVDRFKDIPKLLDEFEPPPATPENQYKIVKKLLESTILGNLQVNDSEYNSRKNWETTSESLKKYLSREL